MDRGQSAQPVVSRTRRPACRAHSTWLRPRGFPMNDERLREAYAELLAQRAALPAVTHGADALVSLEQMRDVLERRGPEATRLALLDRIMSDARTAGEFEVLRAAFEAGGTPSRRASSPAVYA